MCDELVRLGQLRGGLEFTGQFCVQFRFTKMKRTRTAAQIAYPDKWAAARQRRVASMMARQYTPFTPAQTRYIQKLANQGAKRVVMRNSDKKGTQDYSGIISVTKVGGIGDVLTNLGRGDDSLNNFSGSKIIPSQWTFNYNVDFTPCIDETGSTYTSMRFMLIQDVGPMSNNAVGSYMNLTLTTVYDTLALVNWESNDTWRCLYDSGPISIATKTGVQGGNGPSMIKAGSIVIPKKDLRSVFYGDGDSGVNVEKNAIRVLFWSDSSVAPNPVFAYQSEVVFTDGA